MRSDDPRGWKPPNGKHGSRDDLSTDRDEKSLDPRDGSRQPLVIELPCRADRDRMSQILYISIAAKDTTWELIMVVL